MLPGNGGCRTESLTVAIWGWELGQGTRAGNQGREQEQCLWEVGGCGDLCRSQPSADVGWEGWSAICHGNPCRVGAVAPVIPEQGDRGEIFFPF